MITYKILSQRHSSTDIDDLLDRRALYSGGATLKKRAERFLPRHEAESDETYKARKDAIQYRPYMSAIIDHYAAFIFASKPVATPTRDGRAITADPYYAKFGTDCEGGTGKDVALLYKEMLTAACVDGVSWLLVKRPPDMSGLEPPINKLDWENRGLGSFYVERLEAADVLDWRTGPDGSLEWATVHRVLTERASPTAQGGDITEVWEVYDREHIETFAITYPAGRPPNPDDPVASVDLFAHGFGCVPLLHLQLDASQHLGARLQDSQVAHMQALNAEAWSLRKSAYAMPLFRVNDPDKFGRLTMGSGVGIVLGKDENASWLEPTGSHLDALDRSVRAWRDEMFRIASVMALATDNAASSVGRSGLSKQVDAAAARIAMTNFANAVKEAVKRLYQFISACRGETIEWTVMGLDDFDLDGFLEAMNKLREGAGGTIPGNAVLADLVTRAVEAMLPDALPATKAKHRAEIAAAVANAVTPEQREADALASVMRAGHAHGEAA